jgi:7-carboxy-7-deazaguanine synthase
MQEIIKKVQLSEIFTSIEGEGILFGTKTMFIRLAGCHLNCRWCDTAYALPLNSGLSYDISEVKDLIMERMQPNTYKVNFTGGEPLLQYRAVRELTKFVKEKGVRTYIESSCFDSSRFEKVLPYVDFCKIEFKMKDSDVIDPAHYYDLIENEKECLNLAIDTRKVTYIKIVVTRSSSLQEFKELVQSQLKNVKAVDLAGFIIQPSHGVDHPTVERLLDFYDAVYPLYPDVRIIPQLHKELGAR